MPPLARAVLIAALAGSLAACGGDDDSLAPAPLAPWVSQAPASRAVAVGATVRFEVAAVGSAPLSYQWHRNGQPIPGASGASLTLAGVGAGDDGVRIGVTVGNAGGSVESPPALLTVFALPAPSAVCTTPGAGFEVVREATVEVGKAAGAAVVGCSGALTDLHWRAVSGPALPAQSLLSARSQAIAVEPQVAGTYAFEVSLRDAADAPRSERIEIVAAGAAAATRIVVRVDQAVRAGQRASLRAWPTVAAGDAVAAIAWAQIEGPPVELDTSDPARAIFTAPSVARDTVLRLRATLRTAAGAPDSDDVLVVVEALPPPPAGQLFAQVPASRVHPYRVTGAYADRLVLCVYDPALYFSSGATNLCTLGTLPLLAQQTAGEVPSVAQIMDRVLVSHDWMGERFEAFVNAQASDDVRRLLGSVTAIVLGAHVRPSFYWSATGAIYLDADNLWLTAAERDVVSEVPDFRVGFDRELDYSGLWRYVIGNRPALLYFDPAQRLTRGLAYLDHELGSLLWHELAHANDAFPSALRVGAARDRPVFQAVAAQQPSDRLALDWPLASQEMFALARVKFFGAQASDVQKTFSARQVADFFRADRANDEYGYAVPPGSGASPREDLAMLFEEFMMQRHAGARRDVAMTNKFRPGLTGADLIVAWGQRGRIADPALRARVALVLREIAPWIDAAELEALPPPLPLREGASWTANLDPVAGDVTRLDAHQRARGDDPRAIERLLRQREQRLLLPPVPR